MFELSDLFKKSRIVAWCKSLLQLAEWRSTLEVERKGFRERACRGMEALSSRAAKIGWSEGSRIATWM